MKNGARSVGHPVDVATGVVHNTFEDISIPGKVPLEWSRFYSTALKAEISPFGPGWFNKYFCSLKYEEKQYTFKGPDGSPITLTDPESSLGNGVTLRNLAAFTELWFKDGWFVVCQWDVETGEVWHYLFTYERDEIGRQIAPLTAIQDPTGQGVELVYDTKGRLGSIRQKLENRTLLLHYNKLDRIESIEFQSNDKSICQTLFEYIYDESGRLVTATDAANCSDHFEYDNDGLIVRESTKDGAIVTFNYDNKGRCLRTSGIDGYDEKTLTYLDSARWIEVSDSLDYVRRFSYNSNFQVVREVNPLGAEYLTEYDEYGRIVSKTDPLGAITRFEYDEFGNRSKIIDAVGQKIEILYNNYHLPLSYTNTAGNIWQRLYNTQNHLISVKDPEGNSYRFAYDRSGNLITITDPLNNCLHQSFTSDGVLFAASDWQGNVTAYKSDEFGRLIQKTDPLGAVTSYKYDVRNNLCVISYPDSTKNQYVYDSGGNLIQVVDRNGNTTKYRFGPCKRLLERTNPLGNKLYFGWGSEPQRLEAVTNAKGEVYHFEYNAVGWVIRETGFDGRELCFEYDLSGNRTTSMNGMDEIISCKRDALGRLTQQILPDGNTAEFTYDAAGFLQSAVNADSEIDFERDSMGRIIRETQNGHIIKREYDSVGNLAVLESDFGHRIEYEFDPNGLLASFKKNNTDNVQIKRNVRGFETGRILPGGLRLNQQFDVEGRMLEQELVSVSTRSDGPSLASLAQVKRSYRYDNAQLVEMQDKAWGIIRYNYDPAEHLVSALRDRGACERFSFDANDNLTETERDHELETFTYGRGDRLQTKGNTHYEYDDQGRLVLKKETSKSGGILVSRYIWDALDQLRAYITPEGETWEYAYDAFGRRIQKKAPDGKMHGFIWDVDVVLHEMLNDELNVSWVFDRHSFAPLCKFEKSEIYLVITDQLGTPREMLDRFGKIVWQVDYLSWGRVREQMKGEMDCPVRFQGQWKDEESGLLYNRYRYFDPNRGNYITQDPIRIRGGKNLYLYTTNPINSYDPLGLCEGDENTKPPREDIEDMAEHAQAGGRETRIPTQDLADMVEGSIDRAISEGNVRSLEGERTAYMDPVTGRVSIHNPNPGEHSTTISRSHLTRSPSDYFYDLE